MKLFPWTMQKPLRMIWRVEKNGQASHLVGTAHFFPYSFRRPLKRLVRNVSTVMFEGPLDEASFGRIGEHGRHDGNNQAFLDLLTPEAITAIDCILRERDGRGRTGDTWLLSLDEKGPVYFESFISGLRPWTAFFAIWRAYLDWQHSVDMEAYRIARAAGKKICFLETLEEQLSVLDSIPLDRLARQLNDVANWPDYKKKYVKMYLDGDLDKIMDLTGRFAARGSALAARDRVLFERSQPVFACGDALAFVGFPHIPGVTKLFRDAGYSVTQVSS